MSARNRSPNTMCSMPWLLSRAQACAIRVSYTSFEHGLGNGTFMLGLPCIKVPLPSPCSNDVYETRMAHACARLKSQGIEHIVFGDLFLADIRAYREAQLAAAGMQAVFPLWQ